MITAYDAHRHSLVKKDGLDACQSAVWIDLLNPTKEEELEVERRLGIDIPTREEMHEIEISSRLYMEHGVHFVTTTVIYQVDKPDPQLTTITFALTEKHLVTVRYAEPKAFPLFLARANQGDLVCNTPSTIMVGLLETIIDREADLIERLQGETERIAQLVFNNKGGARTRDLRYDAMLKQIGRSGEIASRARESLLSMERVLTYITQVANTRQEPDELKRRIKTEARDVAALRDHLMYLNSRLNFMLDATLGMVTIEQNQIIKLFSVAAVMLMPPTLVASIYGMNFKHMPELEWTWGYPGALCLMAIAAIVPYIYVRAKGWL